MKRLLLTVLALLPAVACGCLPNATWLPDSSGFVYTGGKNKDTLYLYDLAKKEPHVLVEKGAGPAWPAVSADGKRIAVALRRDDGARISLQVIVFDRDGKELHRSEKQDWVAHDKVDIHDKTAPQAFWVPDQDKLLLYSDGVTGAYDLKNKSSVKSDVTLATFGSSPIRPDGKGYLAVKKEGPTLVFIDWDGKENEITPTPKNAFTNGAGDDPALGMILFPLMHASRWDGSTAVVTWSDLRIRVDAEKFTAVVDHIKPAMSADNHVVQDQVRLAGGSVIRAVELTKRYQNADRRPEGDPLFGSYRVEVMKQGAKEPQTLMDGAGFFMIYPSPDGKKAVVKCSKTLEAIFTETTPDADMLYLIDGTGDVTAKIDLAK